MSETAKVNSKKTTEKGDFASKAKKPELSPTKDTPVEQVLNLQQTIGNHTVQGLFKSGVLQPKLKIGQPGDKYELEADRIAEQVMRMPDSVCPTCMEEKKEEVVNREIIQRESFPSEESSFVQRQVGEEERKKKEEEEVIQPKFISSEITPLIHRQVEDTERKKREEEIVQPKESGSSTSEVTPGIESGINSLKGGGQPLSESVKHYFEPRFGYDFSEVRVHTGIEASEAAKAINACAFTIGNDVIFGSSIYSPETAEGRSLLAHELTHVVQQNSTVDNIRMLQRQQIPSGNLLSEKAPEDIRLPASTLYPLSLPPSLMAEEGTTICKTVPLISMEASVEEVEAAAKEVGKVLDTLGPNECLVPVNRSGSKNVGIPLPKDKDIPPFMFAWDVTIEESGNTTKISYQGKSVIIEGTDSPMGRYAYTVVREVNRFQVRYDVRIVAAPDVRINLEGWPEGWYIVEGLNPDIVRVQDPNAVPPQGTTIDTKAYESYVEFDALKLPGQLYGISSVGSRSVGVKTDKSSVLIGLKNIGAAIKLEARNLAKGDRFAYQVVSDFGGVKEVRIVATPGVVTTLFMQGRTVIFIDPLLEAFEVDNPDLVPIQGSPIDPEYFRDIGRDLTFDHVEAPPPGLQETLGLAAIDTGISLIPIIGDLVDIGEFIYAAITGKDRWGRPVTESDMALMGIGALIPFVGGGTLRGGIKAAEGISDFAQSVGKSADDIGMAVKRLEALSETEIGSLKRWDELTRAGKSIPDDEMADFYRVMHKLGGDPLLKALGEGQPAVKAALAHLYNPLDAFKNLQDCKVVPSSILNHLSPEEVIALDVVRKGLPPEAFTEEFVKMLTKETISESGSLIRSNPLRGMFLAGITPDDIKKLRLTGEASPETVYKVIIGGRRTGVKELGIYGMMGERIHDWKTFKELAQSMGPSQRGSMFEHWLRAHVVGVPFRDMKRLNIGEDIYDVLYDISKPRTSDLFIDNIGRVWEFKFYPKGKVPLDQAQDYQKLIGMPTPEGTGSIKEIHYLFSDLQAAKDNLTELSKMGIGVHYITEDGLFRTLFAPTGAVVP